MPMLIKCAREYFRKNEGRKRQIWQDDLALTVTDDGVVVADHDWERKDEEEPETEKWTLTEPDERKKEYAKWYGTWILIDTYE